MLSFTQMITSIIHAFTDNMNARISNINANFDMYSHVHAYVLLTCMWKGRNSDFWNVLRKYSQLEGNCPILPTATLRSIGGSASFSPGEWMLGKAADGTNGRRTDGQVAAKVAAKTRWTGWAPDCNTTQIQCFNFATCRTKTNILEHAFSQHQCSNCLGGVRCKEKLLFQ